MNGSHPHHTRSKSSMTSSSPSATSTKPPPPTATASSASASSISTSPLLKKMKKKMTKTMNAYLDAQADGMQRLMQSQMEIMMKSMFTNWKADMDLFINASIDEGFKEFAGEIGQLEQQVKSPLLVNGHARGSTSSSTSISGDSKLLKEQLTNGHVKMSSSGPPGSGTAQQQQQQQLTNGHDADDVEEKTLIIKGQRQIVPAVRRQQGEDEEIILLDSDEEEEQTAPAEATAATAEDPADLFLNGSALEDLYGGEDIISDCDCDSCLGELALGGGNGNGHGAGGGAEDNDLGDLDGLMMPQVELEEYDYDSVQYEQLLASEASNHQAAMMNGTHQQQQQEEEYSFGGQDPSSAGPVLPTAKQPRRSRLWKLPNGAPRADPIPAKGPVFEGIMITTGIRCTVPNCGLYSTNKGELDQHVATAHRIPPFRCWLHDCGRRFVDSTDLNRHINHDHSGITNWACLACQKPHDAHHKLYQHFLAAHYVRQYQCATQACTFSSTSRSKMYKHYHEKHKKHFPRAKGDGPQGYTCPYPNCGRHFSERCNLRTHERFHLGIKPFKCIYPGCDGYVSEDRANTIRHIRVRHLKLPATVKEQREKGIDNDIDPRQWLQVENKLIVN